MFSNFVPILCVHVSLWTYIFMIGVYLETYTHENRYILSWYPNSFMTTSFFIPFVVYKKKHCSVSARFSLLHPLALIFGEV